MTIADNIRRVEDRIDAACAKVGRDPATITLVGISKLKPAEDIVSAVEAGLQHLGENRVEEGAAKIPQVEATTDRQIIWHMVGHVQSRKAKQVVPLFDLVQSVDSLRLAQRLSRFAEMRDRKLQVLLEVNVSGEASKYGFAGYNWYQDKVVKDNLWREVEAILQLPHIEVMGLMTMAPFDVEESVIRRVFADMYCLREELQSSLRTSLPELSMGMTDDYPIAIEEGATMVRVGRAIFGERR